MKNVFAQNDTLAQSKYNRLLELVNNTALTVTQAAYTRVSTPNNDGSHMFTNLPTKFKLDTMTQLKWDSYL